MASAYSPLIKNQRVVCDTHALLQIIQRAGDLSTHRFRQPRGVRSYAGQNKYFDRLSPPFACKPTPMNAKLRIQATKPSPIKLLTNLTFCE